LISVGVRLGAEYIPGARRLRGHRRSHPTGHRGGFILPISMIDEHGRKFVLRLAMTSDRLN
jgi:hypothetical protein